MPRLKDQAICIRLFDWSETSQIVALLTEHHGKVRGLAKGSKRTSPGAVARFSGGIEMLTQGQIVWISKPSVELATLTEWDLQNPYRHLRQDLTAQRLSLYAADLTGALLAEHDPHPNVFAALHRL
jgi:DNA repair protein RecO (recombination protein O)